MPTITYEAAKETDRCEILALIDRVFSGATGTAFDFEKLLPKAYAPQVRGIMEHHYLAKVDGRIVGVIACYPTDLLLNGILLRVGYIGSVAVAPENRGEGHMIALMKLLRESEQAFGYDFLFLGGQRQRYEHFGFTKAGVVLRYRSNRSNRKNQLLGEAEKAHVSFQTLDSGNTETIKALEAISRAQPVSAIRKYFPEALCSYGHIPRIVCWDGETVGYLTGCANGEIAEIALRDNQMLPAVLNALLDEMPELSIPCAAGDTPKNLCLSQIAESTEVHQLGLIDVMNWPSTVQKLLAVQKNVHPLHDGKVVMTDRELNQTFSVEVRNGNVSVADTEEEPSLALSHREMQELWFGLNSMIWGGTLPSGWAPLPLFIAEPDMF